MERDLYIASRLANETSWLSMVSPMLGEKAQNGSSFEALQVFGGGNSEG